MLSLARVCGTRRFGSTSRSDDYCLSDRGAGTVLWLSAIMVVVMFGLLGIAMTELASGRAKAASAADLGALAGAARALTGNECSAARHVVIANGARLTRCIAGPSDVEIEVAVRPAGLLARIARGAGEKAPQIRMSARAGQPSSDGIFGLSP